MAGTSPAMTEKKMPDPSAWSLHPQLENDTTPVGDLALSRVLAIDDADYPWLILVPRRAGVSEIADLGGDDAARLMAEITQASGILKAVTRCDKLNIGAIGNIVPQLHIHIVARRKDDPLWPKPVWGHAAPRPGDRAAFARFVDAVRGRLGASG
jgi:diadenosine tetraphosphate (Ap4A) HIT family hydrolase